MPPNLPHIEVTVPRGGAEGVHDLRSALEVSGSGWHRGTAAPPASVSPGRIANLEQQVYHYLVAAGEGHDMGGVVAYLRSLVSGTPAGAVAQRARY